MSKAYKNAITSSICIVTYTNRSTLADWYAILFIFSSMVGPGFKFLHGRGLHGVIVVKCQRHSLGLAPQPLNYIKVVYSWHAYTGGLVDTEAGLKDR